MSLSADNEPYGVHTAGGCQSNLSANVETTRHEVTLPHLPDNLGRVTIAQLSDFHRGCGNSDRIITDSIELTNRLSPDMVVLTGDFVNDRVCDILPIARMVSNLRARLGVWAILGNHDHRADAVLMMSALETAGIRLLNNRTECVAPGLWFAGVDDLLEGSPDLDGTLSQLPHDEAVVLLCHNPNGLDLIPEDRSCLVLAGHTHGGQVVLPILTPQLVCRWHLHTEYVQGWYARGSSRMYVNRGIGVTGPSLLARRVNCRPEVSLFTLIPK